MEYVYAALLIHKTGGKIDETTVKKVLEAAGAKPDDAKIKALVASLQGVDINEAVKKAATPVAVAAPVAGAPAETKAEKKEVKEDKKKTEEAAAAGLSALFG